MKLTIIKQAGLPGAPETSASVSGDVLMVNGQPCDLSFVPEGGEALAKGEGHPFAGPITRTGGDLHVPLIWSYDASSAASDQGTENLVLEVLGGVVPDPILRTPDLEDME